MLPLIATAVVACAAIAALAYTALRSRLAPGPPLTGRTVIVQTRRPDDQSVRGILVAQHADRLALREAEYLHADGAQDLGGLVHIPVANVSMIQEIEPPESS